MPVALAAKVLLTFFFYFIKIKNISTLCKMPPFSLPSLLFIPKRSLKSFSLPSTAKHFRLPGSCQNGKRKLTEITSTINQPPTVSQRPSAPESGSSTQEKCQSQIPPSQLCQSKPWDELARASTQFQSQWFGLGGRCLQNQGRQCLSAAKYDLGLVGQRRYITDYLWDQDASTPCRP